jgi:hypothetical protein
VASVRRSLLVAGERAAHHRIHRLKKEIAMSHQPAIHDDLERRARRRVALKLGFGVHALVFVLVNAGLAAINAYTGGPHWSAWPLAGWGLGLAIHGLVTFLNLQGEGWRARMLQSEREHLQRNR